MTGKNKKTPPVSEDLYSLLQKSLQPGNTSQDEIEQTTDNLLDLVSSQRKINAFIDQYVTSEEFINKVRRYARQEIDGMILTSIKSIIGIALGTAITLLVTLIITNKL